MVARYPVKVYMYTCACKGIHVHLVSINIV